MDFSFKGLKLFDVRPQFCFETNTMFLEYLCLSFNPPPSPLCLSTQQISLLMPFFLPLPFLFCAGGCSSLFKIKSNVIIIVNSLWESHYHPHHKQGQGEEVVVGRG